MKPPETFDEILESTKHTLRQLARWGSAGFDCSTQTIDILERWAADEDTAPSRGETLQDIRSDLGVCQRCRLASGRTQLVFGEGNPNARLVFVGEGPGFEEDRSGRPFVGPAGQLLTKIIAAMKLDRQDVYICNVIKCRPPNNRNPQADEISTCRPFLERQIAAIAPVVICTLGTFAAQTLLDSSTPISKLRGQFHDFDGIPLMPTYHPAFLLRNPDRKRDVWEDIKKIMVLLNISL